MAVHECISSIDAGVLLEQAADLCQLAISRIEEIDPIDSKLQTLVNLLIERIAMLDKVEVARHG